MKPTNPRRRHGSKTYAPCVVEGCTRAGRMADGLCEPHRWRSDESKPSLGPIFERLADSDGLLIIGAGSAHIYGLEDQS